VYGYKASHGELSLSGIRPFAESLDSLGVLARSVDDSMLLRSALLGGHVTDPRPRAAPPGLAVCQTAQWSQAEPQAQHAASRSKDKQPVARARDKSPDHHDPL
jgi:Asp-tRNA(Asn)/Glu-tRNA(Gln) amidotransferase A subunit family amidase